MARSRLVLLDANIVIQLHRMGIWAAVCARYEIALTEAVRDESKYFERDDGAQEKIDLASDIEAGVLELIEVSPSDFAKFQAQFDPGYVERLDDGECESLAFLTCSQSDAAECLIFWGAGGDFLLHGVPAGVHTVIVGSRDHVGAVREVEVGEGESKTIEFVLSKR